MFHFGNTENQSRPWTDIELESGDLFVFGGPSRISEDVVAQAQQCLRNIEAALTEANCGFGDVVRVRYLLPDREDFEPCWPVLRAAFGTVRPAATMLMCGLADPRMKIEIEVDARRAGEG